MKIARLIVLGAALCLFNACEQQNIETLRKMESAHGSHGGDDHGAGAHGKDEHGKVSKDGHATGDSKDDGHGH